MIQIENTENLAGDTISGDFYDFCNLVEAFYAITIAEDDLKNSKPKNEYCGSLYKAVIWYTHIIMLRSLQAAFNQCIKETLIPSTYSRWLNIMNDKYTNILTISGLFFDHHNIEYLNLRSVTVAPHQTCNIQDLSIRNQSSGSGEIING